MKQTIKNIFLLSVCLLGSSSAVAQKQWFAGGGLGFISLDDGNTSISPTNIYLRGGYQFNNFFNAGVETSFTASSDTTAKAPGIDFDVDTLTFFVRAGTTVHEKVWVYGQLGRATTKLTAKSSSSTTSDDKVDLMYAIGAEIYPWNSKTYIEANYSVYNDNGTADVSAINLGVGYRF